MTGLKTEIASGNWYWERQGRSLGANMFTWEEQGRTKRKAPGYRVQRDTLCLHTARHREDLPSTKDPQEQYRCSVHMQLYIHPTAELTAPMLPGIPCLASTTWLS